MAKLKESELKQYLKAGEPIPGKSDGPHRPPMPNPAKAFRWHQKAKS